MFLDDFRDYQHGESRILWEIRYERPAGTEEAIVSEMAAADHHFLSTADGPDHTHTSSFQEQST